MDAFEGEGKGSNPLNGVTDMVGNVWQYTSEFRDIHNRAVILRGSSRYAQAAVRAESYYFQPALELHHLQPDVVPAGAEPGAVAARAVRRAGAVHSVHSVSDVRAVHPNGAERHIARVGGVSAEHAAGRRSGDPRGRGASRLSRRGRDRPAGLAAGTQPTSESDTTLCKSAILQTANNYCYYKYFQIIQDSRGGSSGRLQVGQRRDPLSEILSYF